MLRKPLTPSQPLEPEPGRLLLPPLAPHSLRGTVRVGTSRAACVTPPAVPEHANEPLWASASPAFTDRGFVMCRLELRFPESPLLCPRLRVGRGKPREGSGPDGKPAALCHSAARTGRRSSAGSVLCGLGRPSSPAALRFPHFRPGVCPAAGEGASVSLGTCVPREPEAARPTPLPVLVVSSWDDHLLLACLDHPTFKSESLSSWEPLGPRKTG